MTRWQVAIIGAGPGGLCTAIRLAENAAGKIATQLPRTSLWYTERTRQFAMEEYEHA